MLVNGLTTALSGVIPAHLDFSGPILAKLKGLTQEVTQEFDFLAWVLTPLQGKAQNNETKFSQPIISLHTCIHHPLKTSDLW